MTGIYFGNMNQSRGSRAHSANESAQAQTAKNNALNQTLSKAALEAKTTQLLNAPNQDISRAVALSDLASQASAHAGQAANLSDDVRSALLTQLSQVKETADLVKSAAQGAGTLSNVNRTSSQAEYQLVKALYQDLAHPEKQVAQNAEKTLLSMKVPPYMIENVKKALNAASPEQPKFGSAQSKPPADALDEAIRHVINNNPEQNVLNSVVSHQLETVRALAEPLFGAGGWIVKGYNGGYPIMEWSHNAY